MSEILEEQQCYKISNNCTPKVVLCSVPLRINFKRDENLEIPPKIAIVCLLKWMRKSGYEGQFYDIDMLLPSKKEIYDYFKSNIPDVIGLSAVVSTSYAQVKEISQIIRKACPSAWIAVGGNMAVSANLLLHKTNTDICFLGDGEISWVNFLDYVKRNGIERNYEELLTIKGIAFINKNGEMEFTGYGQPVDSNDVPYPDYDILSEGLLENKHIIQNYFKDGIKSEWFKHDPRTYEHGRKPKLAMVWVSKGCVSRCTFCQRFCQGYRLLDLDKLDKHLDELKNKYNVQFIQIADENFGSVKKHSHEVARLLKKYDMLWFAGGVRCTSLDEEDFKLYHDCGCTGIKLGVESGSQKIMDIMEKRYTVGNVLDALKNSHKYNMKTPMLFCIGMPGETNTTIIESGRFLGKVANILGCLPKQIYDSAFYALPLPGAPLYEYAQLKNFISTVPDEEEYYLDYISDIGATKITYLNMTGVSKKDVLFWDLLLKYEATREFYSYPNFTKEQQSTQKFGIRKKLHSLIYPATELNNWLSRSKFISKLPRSLIYIPMRNLVYAEFLALEMALSILGKNKNKSKVYNKRCKQTIDVNLSLRQINKTIKDTQGLPITLSDKNQRTLYEGR